MVVANRPIPRPFVIVVGGGLIGFMLALVSVQRNDTSTSPWVPVVATALGALLALALILVWSESRPFHLRRQIPIDQQDVYRHAEAWFGSAPWSLSRNDGRELVFWRRTEPILLVVVILLFFGVLPGILYYFWARGTQTIYLSVRPLPNGTDLEILMQPRAADGRGRVVGFFNSLHRYQPR